MRQFTLLLTAFALFFGMIGLAGAQECTTIQNGTLINSAGEVITPGYDDWGYNYQARIYNGFYCDSYRDAAWCQAYKDIELMMKWNDAWISNKDCDGDSKLDRHFGDDSYIGSGAWLTNHQSGKVEVNGKMRKWTYFVKIVAAPEDAFICDEDDDPENTDFWCLDGIELGEKIWGEFAIVQQVSNDPSLGEHGILYKSPHGPGFGHIQ